jgi:acyl-CoA thioesterase-1
MREHARARHEPEPYPRQRLSIARRTLLPLLVLALAAVACERTPEQEGAAPVRQPAEPAVQAAAPRIVCLGDSLTAGLGVAPDEAYPALLQKRLEAAGYRYEVVNAGVSGDTSAGGLRRLDWSLDERARLLIVALGGNDALRGLPVPAMRGNLSAIIEGARSRDVAVLLAGMEAPPNFGRAYTREFRDAYEELARQHDVAFVPFLLEGVAGVRRLNQPDGVHPTAEGQRAIAELLWPAVERLLQSLETG